MSKKLDLGNSKFTLWETNHQPMLTTKEKNLPEMVNMGGEISAEDFDPSDVERCFLRCRVQRASSRIHTFQRE